MLGEYLGAGASTTKLLLHLNGNSTDSSGNNNVGTNYDMSFTNGDGIFNGSSSRINYTKSSNNYLINNWTMIAIWKKTSTTKTHSSIYQMGNCSLSTTYAHYYNPTSDDHKIVDNLEPMDIKYYHTSVWTKSSSSPGGKLFVDNRLAGTNTNTDDSANHYINVNVGRFDAPGNHWGQGYIGEFILENRVWNVSEVIKYTTYSKGRFGIL